MKYYYEKQMAQCNYCTLKFIKEYDKAENEVVILREATEKDLGGVNVYIIPNNLTFDQLSDEQKDSYFIAWFMSLPNECEC